MVLEEMMTISLFAITAGVAMVLYTIKPGQDASQPMGVSPSFEAASLLGSESKATVAAATDTVMTVPPAVGTAGEETVVLPPSPAPIPGTASPDAGESAPASIDGVPLSSAISAPARIGGAPRKRSGGARSRKPRRSKGSAGEPALSDARSPP